MTKTAIPAGSTKSARVTAGCGTKSVRAATGYGPKFAPVATNRSTKSAPVATGRGKKSHLASGGGIPTTALSDLDDIFESDDKYIWFCYVKVY